MILVIDDCPRRLEAFKRAFGHHLAVGMDNAIEGVELWRKYEWLRVYLDCDGVYGIGIAQHVFKHAIKTDTPITINSDNHAGAIKMRDILKDTHNVELRSFAEIVGEGGGDGE